MTKAYTKTGDGWYTKDLSGNKIPKDDFSIVIQSKIDLLQSAIDSALLLQEGEKEILEYVQKNLFKIASLISGLSENEELYRELDDLENAIDSLGEPPKEFIRFKTEKAVRLNECRVRCRELEVSLVKLLKEREISPSVFAYVNRLSSLFFMMAYKA